MNQHDAALPLINGPWIEVRGGRTRFPRRPILEGRFLIGSGSNCHLQLGGGMPMAHSVVTSGPSGWTIEALVAHPPLIVSGKPVRQAALNDGDVIQLGPFSLVAHLAAAGQAELLAPVDVEATLAEAKADAAAELAARLAEIPAEELVDRLTTELTAAVMAARGDSAADLIQEAAWAETPAVDEEQLIAEVMEQLAEMSSRLEQRDLQAESSTEDVVSLPLRDAADSAPLRKSA